jgi:trimeric autotransporter adhesin
MIMRKQALTTTIFLPGALQPIKQGLLLVLVIILISYCSYSQGIGVGTTTPHVSATLDISHASKGLLIPRMTPAAITAIPNPAKGLMVYDSVNHQLMSNTGSTALPDWQSVAAKSAWNLTGNSGTSGSTQFIGTTDNKPLRFRVNTIHAGELSVFGNIAWGLRAGENNSTSIDNVAIGNSALRLNTTRSGLIAIGDSALYNNGIGAIGSQATRNMAVGSKALYSNTLGYDNTALGMRALYNNTTGYQNISIGTFALTANTTGYGNTAIGLSSMASNTTGYYNTALGVQSMVHNTTGQDNTAMGEQSMYFNTEGRDNVSIGAQAMFYNQNGQWNVAVGARALLSNTTGNGNTAVGYESIRSNINGIKNTALGYRSLTINTTGNSNTAVGYESLVNNTTGVSNTVIGERTLQLNGTGSHNTALGYVALSGNIAGEENTAVGSLALYSNANGNQNVAMGRYALSQNSAGSGSTAIGTAALYSNRNGGQFNTAIGYYALYNTVSSLYNTSVGFEAGRLHNLGFNNTIIGALADANQGDLFNSVALGYNAQITGSSQIILGNSFTNFIGGYVGFSNISDGRFKKNIQEDVKGIDFIMKLRPVTYNMDIAAIDKTVYAGRATTGFSKGTITAKDKMIYSGFIAQEVEQAAKEAHYDFSGVVKPQNEKDMYSLRYSEFVVPLVKAMQEQQQMIDEMRKNDADQKKLINNLLQRIEKLEKK